MPRIRFFAALVAVLAVGLASASEAVAAAGVSLTNGSGRVVMNVRGSLLGTLERGRLSVRIQASDTQVFVDGTSVRQRTMPDGRVVYTGTGLRFRVFRGGWRVVIDGSGINASAGGRGLVSLRGNGQYSVDGAASHAWSSSWQVIRLGPRTTRTFGQQR